MNNLIDALNSNDIIKTKKIFSEGMRIAVAEILENEKIQIAKSIVIEGEEKEPKDDDTIKADEDDDNVIDDEKKKEKENKQEDE